MLKDTQSNTLQAVINEDELKVDVFRASGGSGVGSWALRITHVPSGIHAIAEGTFDDGANPEETITKAGVRLRAEIEVKLEETLRFASVRKDTQTTRPTLRT